MRLDHCAEQPAGHKQPFRALRSWSRSVKVRRYDYGMPQYRNTTTEADYLRLRAAMTELATAGQFDTNDALAFAVRQRIASHAGDVAAVLGDMADLGDLRRTGRTDGNGAERFELPREAGLPRLSR
jgi:hypothetical protein